MRRFMDTSAGRTTRLVSVPLTSAVSCSAGASAFLPFFTNVSAGSCGASVFTGADSGAWEPWGRLLTAGDVPSPLDDTKRAMKASTRITKAAPAATRSKYFRRFDDGNPIAGRNALDGASSPFEGKGKPRPPGLLSGILTPEG